MPRPLAQGLADKLGFYKLRAKVTVENISADLGVHGGVGRRAGREADLAFADPRMSMRSAGASWPAEDLHR